MGVLLAVVVTPFSNAGGVVGALCLAIPVAFAFACFGGLMGWVISRLVCEH